MSPVASPASYMQLQNYKMTHKWVNYQAIIHICVSVTVAIYKRAQILIGDIWACFHDQGLGHFKDIDTITMFADYR
jgi:hypothetical protein